MVLYLDDWRTPPIGENIKSADNFADFIALVDKYRDCIDQVDLDYDLGYDSIMNGYHALVYIKRNGIPCPHINIHSTHPTGRDIMLKYAQANFPSSVITTWE